MNVLQILPTLFFVFTLIPSHAFLIENGMTTYKNAYDLKINNGELTLTAKPKEMVEHKERSKQDRISWLLWGLLPVAIAVIYIAYRNYKLKKKY